jgi:purine-cytosine permease-like protein
MTPIIEWLEQTSLSTTLRDSPNVFLYPTILAFHTLGLAFFVGISSAIALRLLGAAPGLRLAPFRSFYPVMWVGFLFNAVSGVLLLVIEPTKFLTMVDFYIKLLVIAGAVYCNRWLYLRRFRDPATADAPVESREKAVAAAILVLWVAAITAGRLTAYDSASAQRQTALGTLIVSVALGAAGYSAMKLYGWIREFLAGHAAETRKPQRVMR